MSNLVNTFFEKRHELLKALLEHLQISMLSLLIAIAIAVAFAIFISKYKRASEISLQIAGVMQTIPSLALLGLFIPIMGIGTLPAVVALIIYAIFPIMQNTITGLNEIDSSLQEAATAFGMTRFEKLKKFELELAMPSIVSGVRTAAVMIIGTATLAALVGAGGLGSFILLGIDRNSPSLILIGAISSAILAIIFNFGIKKLEAKKLKTIIIALLTLALLTSLSYLNFNKVNNKTITIAGKLGAEPDILINMYKELIETNSDINVELKPNFGKTSFLYEALKAKEIDIYPEFTGTVTESLLKEKIQNLGNSPREVYEAARDSIKKQDNLELLEPMAYQNTYAIAVTKDFKEKNNLNTIGDLKKVEANAIAGFTLEFNDREDGNKGLISKYGLNLKVKTLEPALRYQAIANGDVLITDVYSTDSQIKRNNLVILKDDKGLFPPYQGAPLLREDTLKKYPELKTILEKLSNQITEEEMTDMNYEVDVNGKSPEEVAHTYLLKKGLVK